MKKIFVGIFVAVAPIFAIFLTTLNVHALSAVRTVVQEESATLLVAEQLGDNIQARISGIDTYVEVLPFEETGAGRYTIFLLDTSINPTFHENALAALNNLVEYKMEQEQFAIFLVAENYSQLIGFTHDRFDLAQAIAGLTWSESASGVNAALDSTIATLASIRPNELAFTQAVIITDGGRGFIDGIAREELLFNINNAGIPVHTIGLLHPPDAAVSNAHLVDGLHSISRISNALSLDLVQTTDVPNITNQFRNYYFALSQINVVLPENLMDGAIRPLELLTQQGVSLLVQNLSMPLIEGVPPAEPPSEPVQTAPPIMPVVVGEPQPADLPLLQIAIIGGVVVIILGGTAATAFIIYKNKKATSSQPQVAHNPQPQTFTEIISDANPTEILIGGNHFAAQGFYISLTDLAQPHKKFETQITGRVEIGREPATNPGIAINYSTKISRRHCMLSLIDGEIWIEDMGSSNKTYVNDTPLHQPQLLRDSDVLKVGDLSYSFRLERR
ncbi:MAG: FHA domain-containing protein [Defluviitaleaceae bacterium]|nr:FHA domain-containing protein [Defluviitaleaceae bacterium]